MTVGDAEGSTPPRGGAGSLALGVGMGLSNILGYAFVLVVSRSLGPADFGAFSAVNNASLFLALPASAFQVVVAAHQARGESERTGIGLSLGVGTVLAVLAVALSPVAADAFHLGSTLPVLLVAAMLPAFMLTGAAQGLLLGHRRLGALAAVYVTMALARVLAAVVAMLLGAGVSGVFAWMLLAAWVPAGLGLALAAGHIGAGRWWDAGLGRELLTSNGTLAVLLAMTSTDILLARHFLEAESAGAYAFAGLFGKVVFWGTQFVALALVPQASVEAMSSPGTRVARGPIARALGLVLVLGAAATAVVAVVPRFLVTALGGADYGAAAGLLVPFTLLGTLWAMCQVLLFAEMARGGRALTVVALGVTALGVVVVWLWAHTTPGHLLATYATAAALVVLAGAARSLTRGERAGGRSRGAVTVS